MQKSDHSQAALILLAIIDKQPNSTKDIIIDSSVKSLYLDYFSAAETLDLLIDQHLVHCSENKSEIEFTALGKPVSRLNISPEGLSVLKALSSTLPKQVLDCIAQLSNSEKKEGQVSADYKMDSEQRFFVQLEEKDDSEILFSLKIKVPTEKMAQNICQNWEKNSVKIYQKIFHLLIKE